MTTRAAANAATKAVPMTLPPATSATTISSNPLSILSIPTEIQLAILKYCLIVVCPIELQQHVKNFKQHAGLFLANKELNQLTTEVYYNCNTFVLECLTPPPTFVTPTAPRHTKFLVPSPVVAKHIRKLELHVDLRSYINDSGDLEPGCANVQYIVQRNPHSSSTVDFFKRMTLLSNAAAWQVHFYNVKDLKILLIGESCVWREKKTNALKRLPQQAQILLTPKRVEVAIRGYERCSVSYGPVSQPNRLVRAVGVNVAVHNPCPGDCKELLKEALESLVQLREV